MSLPHARCSFYVRTVDLASSRHRFTHLVPAGLSMSGLVELEHPPVIGDLIYLRDTETETSGAYRVVDRAWSHAAYGSPAWPAAQARPTNGPWVDIVLEPALGVFTTELTDETADE
jgi:hypothetical protein